MLAGSSRPDDRGLLDSTIVMRRQFGCTPKVGSRTRAATIRRSMACVLAGGGFSAATSTAAPTPPAPATEPVTPDDVSSTIFHNLGIAGSMELQTPTGRPVQLFREGKVIEKLLG